MFASLEPILDLGVPHGVVFFSSFEFVITSSENVVIIGVVSFSSYFLSFYFLNMLGSFRIKIVSWSFLL